MTEIKMPDGSVRTLEFMKYPALEGWDIQREFIEFASSKDKEFRKQFTLRVLQYVKVSNKGHSVQLTTSALVDNHLASWDNLKLAFEGSLITNDIDPETHAQVTEAYWAKCGGELAVAFVAECSKIIGPAMLAATPKE